MKNYTINDLHLLMLHAGFAVHNGDWNWQNVKSPLHEYIMLQRVRHRL